MKMIRPSAFGKRFGLEPNTWTRGASFGKFHREASMVDKELLSRKLSQLREYLSALHNAGDITWEKYEEDLRARAFVERYLQLCIEKVIDIGNHFVSRFIVGVSRRVIGIFFRSFMKTASSRGSI